jgi:hypothetical protein
MLAAQKYLKQKNSEQIVFLEKCFLYIFSSGLYPYNDAFLTYYANSTKNLGNRGNPTTLGRKNGTCHIRAPLF